VRIAGHLGRSAISVQGNVAIPAAVPLPQAAPGGERATLAGNRRGQNDLRQGNEPGSGNSLPSLMSRRKLKAEKRAPALGGNADGGHAEFLADRSFRRSNSRLWRAGQSRSASEVAQCGLVVLRSVQISQRLK